MKTLLEYQLNGSLNLVDAAIKGMTDDEWTSRAHRDANMIGFTLWHCLRTIDWAINGVAAGGTELADQSRWRDMKAAGAFFGAGVSMRTADSIAVAVTRARADEYLTALRKLAVGWLRQVPATDLDRIVDLNRHDLSSRDHLEQIVWPEVEDLDRIPLWQFIARPAVSHIRVHYGEVMAQLALVRDRTEPQSWAVGDAPTHR